MTSIPDFYVTLTSDSSMDLFPNNTVASFTTKLAKHLNLDKTHWRVALSEITYPGVLKTLTTDDLKIRLLIPGAEYHLKTGVRHDVIFRRYLPDVAYQHPLELIRAINKVLILITNRELVTPLIYRIGMRYFPNVGTAEFYTTPENRSVKLILSDRLLRILGFDSLSLPEGRSGTRLMPPGFESTSPVNLRVDTGALNIYTDIINPVVVSAVEEPLLRVVPFKPQNVNPFYSTNEFEHSQYISLLQSTFDEINISIRDSSGNHVHFVDGKCIVTLHFSSKPEQFTV